VEFKVTFHEQVRYRGTLKVTVIVCHTAEHYGEEYDDWNSAVLSVDVGHTLHYVYASFWDIEPGCESCV